MKPRLLDSPAAALAAALSATGRVIVIRTSPDQVNDGIAEVSAALAASGWQVTREGEGLRAALERLVAAANDVQAGVLEPIALRQPIQEADAALAPAQGGEHEVACDCGADKYHGVHISTCALLGPLPPLPDDAYPAGAVDLVPASPPLTVERGSDTYRSLADAVREADMAFEKAGDAGTRTWLDDYFLPELQAHGLTVVAILAELEEGSK